MFRYEKKKRKLRKRLQQEHTRKTILWVRVFSVPRTAQKPSGESPENRRTACKLIFSDMIPAVFGKLKDSGFFFDPVARDIETNFIPSLLEKVKTKVIFRPVKMTLIVPPL